MSVGLLSLSHDGVGSSISGTAMQMITACATNTYVNAVAGLNLSMLIKVMNCPGLSLSELICKAINGGQQGIAQIQTTNNHADEISNNNK